MKLGFALPQIGTEAGPDGLIRAAGLAEKLKYDSVWFQVAVASKQPRV